MKKVTRSVLLLALTLAIPRAASAQGFISPFIGFDFGGDAKCPNLTECEDRNFNLGVAFGTLGPLFGIEEEFAYAKDFFGDAPGLSSSVLTLMTNGLIAPNLGLPVRPYFLAGIGLMKTHTDLSTSSLLDTNNNVVGWDIGGGIAILFTPHVGVRGDLRYFHSFEDMTFLGLPLAPTTLDFGRGAGAILFSF